MTNQYKLEVALKSRYRLSPINFFEDRVSTLSEGFERGSFNREVLHEALRMLNNTPYDPDVAKAQNFELLVDDIGLHVTFTIGDMLHRVYQ